MGGDLVALMAPVPITTPWSIRPPVMLGATSPRSRGLHRATESPDEKGDDQDDQPLPPPSDPTARAMTSKEVSSAAVACSPINAFARVVRGIVSVGLKALELVRET